MICQLLGINTTSLAAGREVKNSAGKESTCNAGDPGLIPGLGRSLGEGNGYPLQNYYNDDTCPTEGEVSTTYFAWRPRSAILCSRHFWVLYLVY